MVRLINHPIPTEAVQHTETNVSANVESTELGTGTLFVTENFVVWLNASNEGIQLEYKQITLHAISRDLQAFPREHMLLHYEGKLPGMNEDSGNDSEENEGDGIPDNESDATLTEIRFVPENRESLESIFEAIAQCQTLHPDEDCQLSDDEYDEGLEDGAGDGLFHGEEGLAHLTAEGRQNLERFNQMLQQTGQGDAEISTRTNQITLNGHDNGDVDDQFEDADDNMDGN